MATETSRERGRAGRAGAPGEVGPQAGPGDTSRARGPGARQQGAAASAAPCVLLAEDDDHLRAVFRRYLREAGFWVLDARSGEEALKIAQRRRGGVDVLVTDVEMPGMGGPELAARMGAEFAGLPVVYVTGNPGSVTEERLDGRAVVLIKPLQLDDLGEAIARLTASRNRLARGAHER